MASSIANLDEERTRRKVSAEIIKFGGAQPPDNWLWNMPVGTVFIAEAKRQTDNFMVMTFSVHRKTGKYVRLYDELGDKFFGDVNPARFTNFWNLGEVLYEPTEEEKETGDG